MKRTLTLIACVAVCCAMTVSCKNAKTAEPTPEEIQAQKVALADSVLAQIDVFADEYILATKNGFQIPRFELTDAEKMIKPKYLLDPSFASNLVSKTQKINALAIYVSELNIRKIYDMPIDETKEVIAKLAIELNHPIENNVLTDSEEPISEKIKKEYEKSRESGDLAYFWQFQYAIVVEIDYLIAQNPELFFSKIKEEQWQAYRNRSKYKNETLAKLARYDEEIAIIYGTNEQSCPYSTIEEMHEINKSKESAKQFRIANRDKYIARRNALLQ